MADNRKNNGNKGHSTKAKGVDKRKNEYKDVVKSVVTVEKLADVLKMLLGKAIEEQDIPASKLLLEYSLGKPTETKDITINEIQPLFPDEL
ncbi:MAG: hypothetical protein H8E55_50445 [Pelagibacterales bacterium]|nr:hypothetical protein [Pelagibacterales bacterium]